MTYLKSIRTQIILFCIFISVVSSAIVSITNYLETKKLLSTSFDRELADTATLIRMNIEENLKDARHTVSILLDNEKLKSLEKEKVDEICAHFIDFVSIFYNIYVYDRKGNLVSVVYFDRADKKEIHSPSFMSKKGEFHDVAIKVLADGVPRFTKPFYRKERLLTAYVAPIISGKEIGGIVSCGIFVDNPKLKNLLKSLVPPYSGFICLLDSEGNIFGREGEVPPDLPAQARKLVLRKASKSPLILRERAYRYTIEELKDTDLHIMVAVSEGYMKNTLANLAQEVIALNLVSLLLSLGISTLLANLLVDPLKKLVEGLKEIGRGNYAHRVDAKVYGEMEEAVQSFNEMSEKLEKNRMIEKIWNESWKIDEPAE